MTDARAIVVKRLRRQAESCRFLGSELYAFLLERSADDAENSGPVLDLLASHAHLPGGAALALRYMGGVHRLVLEREAVELAPFYPSVGGQGRVQDAWEPFLETVQEHADRLRVLLDRTVQTNEVGRSAALLSGFFRCARTTGKPLRLLELGSSAGLNLRWDHYRYDFGGDHWWGDEDSPVVLRGFVSPPDPCDVEVVSRQGCDPDPIDPTSADGRLTLSSYVWPDQTWRWEQLRGALAVATDVPAQVERMPASEFLHRELSQPTSGVTTLVFHSVVIQYMSPTERRDVISSLEAAAEAATAESPVAWLRMEPPAQHFQGKDHWQELSAYFPEGGDEDPLAHLHLNVWPHAPETVSVGRAGYHGRPIHPE